jgi:hypothetical protein
VATQTRLQTLLHVKYAAGHNRLRHIVDPTFSSGCGALTISWRDDMPRFFFHIETHDLRFNDTDGHELISLNAAHEHALRLIDKTTKFVWLPKSVRWTVNVCDTSGHTVLVVLFPVHSLGWFGSVLNGQQYYCGQT